MAPKKRTNETKEDTAKEEPPAKVQKGEHDKDEKAVKDESAGVKVLEKGHIFFLYRPKVDSDEVESASDVQKVYMVLKPNWHSCKPKRQPTLIVLGRKKLPDPEHHSRYWGFVAEASKDLTDAFKEHSYETKTRGERTVHPSRPMGEGVYEIATHNGHSHLAYMLTLPDKPHEVQEAFNIEEKASIIMAVKNPEKSSPPSAGLSSKQKADFPKELMEAFADRRFIQMETTEFLNYKDCELMLIGASKNVEKELGKAGKELKEMEKKDEEHIEHVGVDKSVFDELEIEKSQNPGSPLQGDWA
ncbi:hypothetical protein O0I10_004690 [Lichtheimia ornata]|uniref:Uncharacterized protein n=1 Tax=Lichtheimia ornata TaxID=688661 RepID=A0AAD7Y0E5_9FUNG|nr:uncharacterized protein O0I10_004690 [Lichtheimia ornata]KAJ8659708.1 hypothetical protein O0I10_004690 [Lichtheimia ornata]